MCSTNLERSVELMDLDGLHFVLLFFVSKSVHSFQSNLFFRKPKKLL